MSLILIQTDCLSILVLSEHNFSSLVTEMSNFKAILRNFNNDEAPRNKKLQIKRTEIIMQINFCGKTKSHRLTSSFLSLKCSNFFILRSVQCQSVRFYLTKEILLVVSGSGMQKKNTVLCVLTPLSFHRPFL